jgi:GT2 family glycosyltransferase
MLLRREVALATGGFDERYFMYWEDADWCRRMAGAGFRVVCDPRAVVVHDEGAGRGRSARQVLAFHRSAYLYFSRHHLQGAWRLLRPAARTALTLRGALTLVVGHRPWRGRGSGRDRS